MTNRYLFGILIVIAGGACLSTSGILIRLTEQAEGWQIVLYRSIAFFLTILIVVIHRHGRRTLDAYANIGPWGILAATLLGLGSVCYIFAILNTTVANVVFIIGSAPLITAALAWLILKERLSKTGIITMVAAVAGIGLMFIDGLVSGGLLGNALALLMVIMFAFYLLILRAHRDIDMIPATGLSGIVSFCVAAFIVQSPAISFHDLIICILLGSLQLGLGFLLLTIGTRFLPAAEVALFALSESILGPLWVWIGVNEVPSVYTLYGSAIVLTAVITYSIIAIRNPPPEGG